MEFSGGPRQLALWLYLGKMSIKEARSDLICYINFSLQLWLGCCSQDGQCFYARRLFFMLCIDWRFATRNRT